MTHCTMSECSYHGATQRFGVINKNTHYFTRLTQNFKDIPNLIQQLNSLSVQQFTYCFLRFPINPEDIQNLCSAVLIGNLNLMACYAIDHSRKC